MESRQTGDPSPISQEESKIPQTPSPTLPQETQRSRTAPPPLHIEDADLQALERETLDIHGDRGRTVRKTIIHVKERSLEQTALKRTKLTIKRVPSLKLDQSRRKSSPIYTPRTKSKNANRGVADSHFLTQLNQRHLRYQPMINIVPANVDPHNIEMKPNQDQRYGSPNRAHPSFPSMGTQSQVIQFDPGQSLPDRILSSGSLQRQQISPPIQMIGTSGEGAPSAYFQDSAMNMSEEHQFQRMPQKITSRNIGQPIEGSPEVDLEIPETENQMLESSGNVMLQGHYITGEEVLQYDQHSPRLIMRPNYAMAQDISYPSGSPHDLEYGGTSQDEFEQRHLAYTMNDRIERIERAEEQQRSELKSKFEEIYTMQQAVGLQQQSISERQRELQRAKDTQQGDALQLNKALVESKSRHAQLNERTYMLKERVDGISEEFKHRQDAQRDLGEDLRRATEQDAQSKATLQMQFIIFKKEFEKKIIALLQQNRSLQEELVRVKSESLEERKQLNDRLIVIMQENSHMTIKLEHLHKIQIDQKQLDTRSSDIYQKEIELGHLEAQLLRRDKALLRTEKEQKDALNKEEARIAQLREQMTQQRLKTIEEIDGKMASLLQLYQELKDKENLKDLARRDQDKYLELHSWNYPLSASANLEERSLLEELKTHDQQDSPIESKSLGSTAPRTPELKRVNAFKEDGQVGKSPRTLGLETEVGKLKTWQFLAISILALLGGTVLSKLI